MKIVFLGVKDKNIISRKKFLAEYPKHAFNNPLLVVNIRTGAILVDNIARVFTTEYLNEPEYFKELREKEKREFEKLKYPPKRKIICIKKGKGKYDIESEISLTTGTKDNQKQKEWRAKRNDKRSNYMD
jgi:hypothetical protein